MIPDPAPPFELDMSGALRDRVIRMLRRAASLGVIDPVARDVAEILHEMTWNPRTWGDPLRHFRHVQFVQYRSIHGQFRSMYTVHDRLPLVVFTELTPLEGNPLYGESFDEAE